MIACSLKIWCSALLGLVTGLAQLPIIEKLPSWKAWDTNPNTEMQSPLLQVQVRQP